MMLAFLFHWPEAGFGAFTVAAMAGVVKVALMSRKKKSNCAPPVSTVCQVPSLIGPMTQMAVSLGKHTVLLEQIRDQLGNTNQRRGEKS